MTVFIQVDGRQEAGQAGGGGPGRRARQESQTGGRPGRGDSFYTSVDARRAAGQVGGGGPRQSLIEGGPGRSDSFYTSRWQAGGGPGGRRRARQEAAGQAGGGGPGGRRRARREGQAGMTVFIQATQRARRARLLPDHGSPR